MKETRTSVATHAPTRQGTRLVVAFLAGGLLVSLAWALTDHPVDDSPRPDTSGDHPDPAWSRLSQAVRCPPTACPAAKCPAAAPCPRIDCDLGVAGLDPELRTVEPETVAQLQAAVSQVMAEMDVPVAFDLECAAYPCLAVFVGETPSEGDRDAIARRLRELSPDRDLTSSLFVRPDNSVVWAVVLADAPLGRVEKARVEDRIEALIAE